MSDLLLFALGSTRPLGEGVSRALGAPLAAHEEREFEWGQHKARPLVNVRGRDAYVLHSLHGEPGQSANDKLCRLLFFVGALRDAGAGQVTAVVPFLCYSRKDRRTKPRDPVTTRYVAALFEAVGTDRVVTVDVHNLAAYQNAFRCRAEHLEGRPLFVERLAPGLREQEVVVVSPDAGGVHRAEAFRASLARALGRPVELAFVEKRRSEGVVSGDLLAGDVRGRAAVVVDDMISSGTTTLRAARRCLDAGATRVLAAASHAVFTPGADEALADPALERVLVLGTAPPQGLVAARDKVEVLDVAPLLGEAVRRLHEGGSLV
ncbi:MAG: ribose-phosphate pyrophosphokinase [Planctomycetes bacterium]|nr:ribose-phosphate pyrophosphokinase [Planctomycetota bacterium]